VTSLCYAPVQTDLARLIGRITLCVLALLAARAFAANEQVSEVIGVVTGMGSAGAAEDEDEWSLSFALRPWRIVGGSRDTHELRVRREGLAESELRDEMERYGAGTIVRLKVRLPATAKKEAQLLEYLGRVTNDREMNDWVAQRAKPVVVKDSILGTLTLDRSANAYEGERKYRNKRYRLFIDRGSDDDDAQRDQKLIESRRAVVTKAEAAMPSYLAAAADELLDLYNETWRGSATALDRDSFTQRLSLDTVSIDEDGGWTVYFDDGGLFQGHSIQLSVEPDGEVADVDLAG
jgi:hypothetical protein